MPGSAWAADVLARRREERGRMVTTAREYVSLLAARLDLVGAAVIGSVARGDFNVWSDVDVVVVAHGLPERYLDRASLLSLVPGRGIEAVAFTPQELRTAYEKGDPRVVELERYAVFLSGERALKALLERD
jgi:predicted nucleotidyltransferase